MNNENNTKRGLPQELPEELLADVVAGDGKYSDKGYPQVQDIYGTCEKYVYRHDGERINGNPDDCMRCRYFRFEMGAYGEYTPYCTYPDDWTYKYYSLD